LGYERSADVGNNVFVNGIEVNHQFDKSSAFLARAVDYIRCHIGSQIVIQSPISSMWELQIARVFCEEPTLQCFHSLFLSCNEPVLDACSPDRGFDWCLRCDKCSFIYLLLSAWLTPSAVIDLFHGHCLFHDDAVESTFMKLIDKEAVKPFDCVGTVEESSAAIHLSLLRYIYDGLHWSENDIDAMEVDGCLLLLSTHASSDGLNAQGSNDGIPPIVYLPIVLMNMCITLLLIVEVDCNYLRSSSRVHIDSSSSKLIEGCCYKYFDSSILRPDDVLQYWKLS